MGSQGSEPAPITLRLGAINPYALTEAILGRKIDWKSPESAKILSDTLETDYNELFDMKFNSPIYAGLKLEPNGTTVLVKPNDITILDKTDCANQSLKGIKTLGDLKSLGIKNLDLPEVQRAWLKNGKIQLVLDAPPALSQKITNTALPKRAFDIIFNPHPVPGPTPPRPMPTPAPPSNYTPPGSHWQDVGTFFKDSTQYSDPIQGSLADCWLISAMSAVAWADPYGISERNRSTSSNDIDHVNGIQFFSNPGGRDAPTAMVEVTDAVLVSNDNSNSILYCRSRDDGEIWPDVYEKAFAKWTTRATGDMPDMSTLNYGDCVKAMAQLTGKTPYYYSTASQTGLQLWTLVCENSMSMKTINPMTAWTYPSGPQYDGSNIVANHCYTILGWAYQNGKEYIVLRNPWGVTEPTGLNTYQGLLSFWDTSFWRHIDTIGNDGVFALEATSFQIYYAGMGVAK